MLEWIRETLGVGQTIGFAISCGVFGLLVVTLDILVYQVQGTSFLKLSYPGVGRGIAMLVLWGLGAAIGGLLGALAEMLLLTTRTALAVGGSWPLIVPRLIAGAGKEVEQK